MYGGNDGLWQSDQVGGADAHRKAPVKSKKLTWIMKILRARWAGTRASVACENRWRKVK